MKLRLTEVDGPFYKEIEAEKVTVDEDTQSVYEDSEEPPGWRRSTYDESSYVTVEGIDDRNWFEFFETFGDRFTVEIGAGERGRHPIGEYEFRRVGVDAFILARD